MRLSNVTLFNNSVAGSSPGVACDWQNEAIQQRRVFISAITGPDTITVEGSMNGTTWAPLTAALTAVGSTLIEGPIGYIRVTKAGAAGVATVTGLV